MYEGMSDPVSLEKPVDEKPVDEKPVDEKEADGRKRALSPVRQPAVGHDYNPVDDVVFAVITDAPLPGGQFEFPDLLGGALEALGAVGDGLGEVLSGAGDVIGSVFEAAGDVLGGFLG